MKRFLMIIVSTAMAALVMVALARGLNSSSTASAQSIQADSAAPAAQASQPNAAAPAAQAIPADPAGQSALATDQHPNDGSHAGGQVSAVSGSTITVTTRDGGTKDILTTSATTFELDGAGSSLGAIAAGQFVIAEGTTDSSGAFTASEVHASTTQPQGRPGPRQDDGSHAGGQVSAVSGSTITVTAPDGSSKDILTTSATSFELDGAGSSLSAIAAGQFVRAEGTTDSSGAFTASEVHASTTQPQGRPGDGQGPRGPRP